MRMKVGEPIRAELLYPVYVDNKLVVPAKTVVSGHVVSLAPDRPRRLKQKLLVDFTPYHNPTVRFEAIVPPSGPPIAITTGDAADGAPVYRVVPKPAVKGGIVGQYFQFAVQHVKDTVTGITGPDKGDRIKQFVYAQLPYRPERLEKGTAWTVETTAPVTLGVVDAPPPVPEVKGKKKRGKAEVAEVAPKAENGSAAWTLQAYLTEKISSETSKADDVIHATVAEPILNADGSVAVPEGAILTGTVIAARPARKFTRAGELRFGFTELKMPGQATQTVRTTLAGADSSSAQQLALNSDGQMKPKAQDKIFVPALLILMASQPLDQEKGGTHHMVGKNGVASSGLGLVSLIVGTAAQQPNVAMGLGYYRAALSIYPRYFGKGTKVEFPKDTRVVIQTTPTRSAAMKPNAVTTP